MTFFDPDLDLDLDHLFQNRSPGCSKTAHFASPPATETLKPSSTEDFLTHPNACK